MKKVSLRVFVSPGLKELISNIWNNELKDILKISSSYDDVENLEEINNLLSKHNLEMKQLDYHSLEVLLYINKGSAVFPLMRNSCPVGKII